MPQLTYRTVSFGNPLGIGITGSFHVSISAVAKKNADSAPYCMPNELICAGIGRFLCLPIPPCGVIHAPASSVPYWFASLDFNHTGNALPPVDPTNCFRSLPDLSTGLLLFDALVANSDRHSGNFSLDSLSDPVRMDVFDHSHALFGSRASQGCQRLDALRDRLGISGGSQTEGNRHCLIDVISTDEHFEKWLKRIAALPDFLIEEICLSAVGLGIGDAEAEAAFKFLSYRRNRFFDILRTNRDEFRAISQWRVVV